MSQGLNPQVVRRLAFIRFMYTEGLENAQRAQPLGSTALSFFHDAVEMFLLLAAEHLGVGLPKHVDFDGYFTEIAKAASVQLPGRNAMRRMNNSRVNFKHHGSIPSAADLEQFRADVTTFFADATQMVFAADFDRLDMTDLVTQQDALEKLRDAEAHAERGDHTELSRCCPRHSTACSMTTRTANAERTAPPHKCGYPAGDSPEHRSTAVNTIQNWWNERIKHSPRRMACSGPCAYSQWT